jgi:hypothetical protein
MQLEISRPPSFWPLSLLGEVVDKQRTIPEIVLACMIIGAMGFIICRKWPRSVLGFLACVGFLAYLQISDIHEPAISQAILAELGFSYFFWVYFGIAVSLAGPLAGFILSKRGQKAP